MRRIAMIAGLLLASSTALAGAPPEHARAGSTWGPYEDAYMGGAIEGHEEVTRTTIVPVSYTVRGTVLNVRRGFEVVPLTRVRRIDDDETRVDILLDLQESQDEMLLNQPQQFELDVEVPELRNVQPGEDVEVYVLDRQGTELYRIR